MNRIVRVRVHENHAKSHLLVCIKQQFANMRHTQTHTIRDQMESET